MGKPTFLILLPIHRPPDLLEFAIESVLNQSRQDFELHIVCDGAPASTLRVAAAWAHSDNRIFVHFHPKGEGHGEHYRDLAIRENPGRFVCQIADDDLWFPNHLAEIERLLEKVQFGHTIQIQVESDGKMWPIAGDLSDPQTVSKMLAEHFNIFGPTAAGYRRDTYLDLEEGWTPAEVGVWSDLHMWRKFLRRQDISSATRFSLTNLHIAAPFHAHLSIEERAGLNAELWHDVSDPARLDSITQAVLKGPWTALS